MAGFVELSEKTQFSNYFEEDNRLRIHRLPLFKAITDTRLDIDCLKDTIKDNNGYS
jgi:hypothetical protein